MARTLRDKRINQIMYFSVGGVIVAIIAVMILTNIFSKNNKKNFDVQTGENNSVNSGIEQVNTSIGKTIQEAKNVEQQNEEESLQVQVEDEKHEQGELSEDLDENIDLQENVNNVGQVANETSNSSNLENSQDVMNSTNEINSASVTKEDNTASNVEEKTETPKDPTFTMPVQGEISKHYGKEKLIYSDTLKEWTTHLGIDIKADKTTVVKSSADGIVKSIKNDPRYGLTVVVEHENGFSSVYSNLLTAEFVVVGENVKSGQTLGTVGNSATFEILDDAHLHFEILKDGNAVDPEMYVR